MSVRYTAKGEVKENPPAGPAPTEERLPDGQHADHWVMSPEERAKGFVRPVRRSYVHQSCGAATTMGRKIAETYAVNPGYYGATFCARCGNYYPVGAAGEFVWDDGTKVGT